MSKDIAKLVVKLEAQTKKYDEKLSKANKTIKRFHAQQRKSLKGISSDFVKLLGGVAVGAAVASFSRSVIQTTMRIEQLKLQLETVTGSASNASKAFEMIEEFATKTPFQVEELTAAFIKLQALGLDPSAKALESYGNTSSAMGKSLNQMIEAVADAATGEFERLKEFGIKAKSQGEEVTFIFQGVSTKIGKNAAEITQYLQGLGDVQFAGAMEKQATSLTGVWSNLQDQITRAMTVEGPALDNLTEQLKGLEAVIASPEFQSGVQAIATAMINFAASGAGVVTHWGRDSKAQEAIAGMAKSISNLQKIQKESGLETLLGMPTSRMKSLEPIGEEANAIMAVTGFATVEELQRHLTTIHSIVDKAFEDLFNGVDVEKNTALIDSLEAVTISMQDQISALKDGKAIIEEISGAVSASPSQMLPAPTDSHVALFQAYNDEMQKLADTLTLANVPAAKFESELAKLNEVWASGKLGAEAYSAAFLKLLEDFEGLPDATEEVASEMDIFAEEAARNMQDAFADFLFDPFADGLDGMLKGFLKIMQRMAAEQLAANIFGSLPGLFGAATPGGAPIVDALPTMNGGGFTGTGGRFGGVDGLGGFMALLHPNETVIDHTLQGSAKGSSQITIAPQFSLSAIDSRGMAEVLQEQQGVLVNLIDQHLNEKGVAAL